MNPQFPPTFDCGIRLPVQDRAVDCWADCVAGVLGYLGVTATQDDVRQKAIGNNDQPMPWQLIAGVFEGFGVTGIGPNAPLSALALHGEVTAGPIRPVLVGYEWAAGGGHVAIITGWRQWTSRFLVQDPFFGPGELSYWELLSGYGIGRWAYSWGRFRLKDKP